MVSSQAATLALRKVASRKDDEAVPHEKAELVANVGLGPDPATTECCRQFEVHYGRVQSVQLNAARLIQGKAYPRMEFNDAAGETLFAVVGFEGAEIFEEKLAFSLR